MYSLVVVMPMLICVRLDSRQRKKMHTEKLEEEKKQFTSVMTELEETRMLYTKNADSGKLRISGCNSISRIYIKNEMR